MKTYLTFIAGAVAGGAGVWIVGRAAAPANPALPASPAAVVATENSARSRAAAPAQAAEAGGVAAESKSAAKPADTALPAPASAAWVKAARDVDRRYGIIYRICSLLPGERRLVRDILTRESLLATSRERAKAAGVPEADVERQLAGDRQRLEEEVARLAKEAPEVSAFLDVCRQHPASLDDTAAIAERIVNETGGLDPAAAESIFSCIVHAEVDHPLPPYLVDLDLSRATPAELTAAETLLSQRNAALIPDLSGKLPLNQTIAAISFYEEQLDAVKQQRAAHASNN